MMWLHADLLLRVLVGTVLGAAIGYERRLHRRPAGLRTHLLVSLASSTFMVVSTNFMYFQHYQRDELVAVDPSRIAASVVTGVGFLGGGAILRTGVNVQGLTTAAGLWLCAAIGLSAGAGMYVVSVFSTVLGVVALTLLRQLEHKEDDRVTRRVSLTLGEPAPGWPEIIGAMRARRVAITPGEYERRLDEGSVAVTFYAHVPVDTPPEELIAALESQPGVRRVRIESS
jgi:putative Mg2+ transporter-C (MgtC) family protein